MRRTLLGFREIVRESLGELLEVAPRLLEDRGILIGVHADAVGADRASECAASCILVAESGIRTRADVVRLARCGVGAILVGESLMRHPNLEDKVAELLAD